MPVLERILSMGITGSGKSYQWLKLAEALKPTGAIFRCLDTDNAIPFMLETQFPNLKSENGGNIIVHQSAAWPEYKAGIDWLLRRPFSKDMLEYMAVMEPDVVKDHDKTKIKPTDWTVIDMADNAWKTVQSYFVQEVFGDDPGEYFLRIRQEMEAGKRRNAKGGMPSSPVMEGLDGWKDWSVINKLYDDWINPIVYRIPTHVYTTTKVEKVDKTDKDVELQLMFGDVGLRPAGQKALGHQMHTIFLMIPGKAEWYIKTIKDRGGRPYFDKVKLKSLFMQYLVAKAGWNI